MNGKKKKIINNKNLKRIKKLKNSLDILRKIFKEYI